MKRGFLSLVHWTNQLLRKLTYLGHALQFRLEWSSPPYPPWFDHNLDLFYQWEKHREAYWLERGIFNLLAIKQEASALEICCGEGFNAKFFYARRVRHLLAVDLDQTAITFAKSMNSAPNVRYEVHDILKSFPEGAYDNIIWDAAIAYFSPEEIQGLLAKISQALGPKGVLSGYTLVDQLNFEHHKVQFNDRQSLHQELLKTFAHVLTFETKYESRHNLYFYASQMQLDLPFLPASVSKSSEG